RGSHRSGWSTLRWMYSLATWLRESSSQFDAVLAVGLRHEAFVAIRACQPAGLPVVLLATEDDAAWRASPPLGGRIAGRCQQARAIIAQSSQIAGDLQRRGYIPESLTVIPRTVAI